MPEKNIEVQNIVVCLAIGCTVLLSIVLYLIIQFVGDIRQAIKDITELRGHIDRVETDTEWIKTEHRERRCK